MQYVVEVEGLWARYVDVDVLRGVNLRVAPRQIHAILGGSGCGKSTLLKHIIGLLEPTQGSVRLLGVDRVQAEEAEWTRVLSRVGMLFQGGALLNALTIHENVALPILEFAPTLPRRVVDEMVMMKLSLVGLSHAARLTPPSLSGGMKKRAALARAMALDPLVLFCDEPSAGLDPVTAAQLDDLILSLRDRFDMAVVIVTHELPSIVAIADHATMLSGGQVLVSGALGDVRRHDHPEVRAFFDRSPSAATARPASLLATLHEGGTP
ncbi:MAG: ATP-binding cassette domain-containing protein [Pseudomonadota bacterium]